MPADIILHNAKIAINTTPAFVAAVAIQDGRISAAGSSEEILRQRGPATLVIDAQGRTAIPGLNDSHIHTIRGGPFTNLAPPLPPASPGWSPVAAYRGYTNTRTTSSGGVAHSHGLHTHHDPFEAGGRWGSGCDCFLF
jgi:predicted amidohydrolase YtcJ